MAFAVHFQDMDMVGEAVEERAGQSLGAEDAGPFIEGQVRGVALLLRPVAVFPQDPVDNVD